jgi:Domain of unknown function (DUF4276)
MGTHLAIHVEEQSMEVMLRTLLPRVLEQVDFEIYTYQGKHDLLRKLPARLQSQASWLPPDWKIIVIVDADDDDCEDLREHLDAVARKAKLVLRGKNKHWQIVNRIAIEELEAWYFGDWDAVRTAYPRVPVGIPRKQAFRNPDMIAGGTWEALERILVAAGYHIGGLQKISLARAVAQYMELARNSSASFSKLRDVLLEC